MREGIKLYFEVGGFRCLYFGILGKVLRHQYEFSVIPPGAQDQLRLRAPSTDVTTYRQVFVREEYRAESRYQARVIIDAGANIGLASIYFALKFPHSKILALEPEPANFELLSRNVRPYSNVIPIHAALWNTDGDVDLCDPGLGESGYTTRARRDELASGGSLGSKVRAITINTLLAEFDLQHIDVLKVDIEGAELEVFGGAEDWIDIVSSVVIELHERLRAGCEQTFDAATAAFSESWSEGENTFRSRDEGCLRGPT